MHINLLEELGRAHRSFIAHNANTCNSNRDTQAGVSQSVMIKKVVRSRAELVELQHPALGWDRQPNIALLVTLAPQRQKSLVRRDTQYVWRNRIKRRRLIITAVRAPQDPVQMRNLDRHSQARAAYSFRHEPGKTRESHACRQ